MVRSFRTALMRLSMSLDMSALNRKLIRDLWRLKGQAFAIATVVAAGIGLLIGTYGCLAALGSSKDRFYDRYRFAEVWANAKRAPNSLQAKLEAIPGVQQIETRIVADVTLDVANLPEPARGRIISVPEGRRPLLNDFDLREGRVPAHGRPNEIVVSEAFAMAHGFTVGDGFSAILNGKKRKLDIVGIALTPEYIYALAPGAVMPDDLRYGILWMGREALAAAFDLDESFNSVTASLLHGAVEADVLAALDHLLKPYGGVGAHGRKDQISDFFLTNELKQMQSSGAIAPPIFLGVAAFLLNVVLTRLVETEREQIGLLKAFGYTDWDVGLQYAKLVSAIIGLGLMMGIAVGFWFGDGMITMYSVFFKFPLAEFSAQPELLAIALFVTALAGLIGGAGAVRRSIALSPAVAMAPPAPVRYRKGRIAAWFAGFGISQPTRMIFRHVTRWPRRTALTVIGIAFSVALLVASLFFLDSVKVVIEGYFRQSERQNLTVSFVEPRNAIVEEEIERLPGVLATQPVRAVMVRLRNGNLEKRTALVGLVPNPDLNRVLNADQAPIDPPEGGVALSRAYADHLDVKLGDLLTIEVMQERRPTVVVPITQIVDQYMGFAAFMRIDAINRLMKEGPVLTGVHVLTDKAHVNELYRRIKNMPAVAGIAQRDAALASFQKTLNETMMVMIGFYIAFSSLIAVGVAYNSARIAFSERARALASLRVLGFTRAEVAYILLGELAVQTLLALPVGCLMGYGIAVLMSPMLTTDMYHFPFIITDATYGISVAVTLACGIVCAWLIRGRVYKLDLVSVLKTRE
ncbi:MAG: FtsX-like permease family protein [Alphaproteobacteria bacterium]|nr:FtsX-like permease family protein [Alphaproteobacteria bacterium]